MTALADLPLIASGKVREMYELAQADKPGDGRPAADGRQRPHLDLRRRPPDADPRQGQGAHRPVGLLVRTDGRDRPQPPALGRRGRARGGARSRAGRAQPEDASGRVRRARLHHRLGLEGLPGDAARSRGIALPAGLRESEQLPEPIFTPSTKADDRPRRERSTSSARRELVGDADADEPRARRLDRALLASPPSTRASAA